ncbi:hypothetical protein CALVIDRAFT_562687 [Calocera viscosa TUFC12733]|uniref:Uncharacterized protein n=1 Tax=Calocera viscosa (strain TUFC12733) TaxID=1330018 RepID=A0A167NJN7_CALVF|nr:hypothetical protein CALVIDRAFT_562687 [Calocera viscosa TUFC12733]
MTSDIRNHIERMGPTELRKMVKLAQKAMAAGQCASDSDEDDNIDPSLKNARLPVRSVSPPQTLPLSNSQMMPDLPLAPEIPTSTDRWAAVVAEYAEAVQENVKLKKHLRQLEEWREELEQQFAKKSKVTCSPDCPAAKKDCQLSPKELAVSRVVRDLLRTQMYDIVGYVAGKRMPGPGRPAPARVDGETPYLIVDWDSPRSTAANQAFIQHAVRLVRQAHLDFRLEREKCGRSENPTEGQDNFNKLPQDSDDSLTEDEEPPLIDVKYQKAWLSTENLLFLARKIYNNMKQVWTNQKSDATQARAAGWGSNSRRTQRRVTRADRLGDGAKIFAEVNGIVDVDTFCRQIMHMDWVGDLDSCDEDGEKNDGWWAWITDKAGLEPEQRNDKKIPLWEWKRPAWMNQGIWQLYATFNHLKWLHEPIHPVSTPSYDLGRASHRAPHPRAPKPWAFMVDEAYLAANPGFAIRQELPETLTEDMCEELKRVNNRFIHRKFLVKT